MAFKIALLPSNHAFSIEKNETLLDAALRAGLPVDYGCSNGSCGKCQAKLVSGGLEKLGHQDYTFSEAEKLSGQFLMCCNGINADAIVETRENSDTATFEQQTIPVKIKKIETPARGIKILHVRSPRTQRLRYLAGQSVTLICNHVSRQVSIASCPCDALNQQFHIAEDNQDDFFSTLFATQHEKSALQMQGPQGSFTLHEDCRQPVLFFAFETGFGPIKGLIEHALSLELSQQMVLVWVASSQERHYMHNYCRSIADAVDNFDYIPVVINATLKKNDTTFDDELSQCLNTILEKFDLPQFKIYLSANSVVSQLTTDILSTKGVPARQIQQENLI